MSVEGHHSMLKLENELLRAVCQQQTHANVFHLRLRRVRNSSRVLALLLMAPNMQLVVVLL